MHAGQKLKALRYARGLSGRAVDQASRRIAGLKADKRFCISNGWLTQLENGASEPSICKIFSLSVIYHVKFFDLIRLYGVDVDEIEKYQSVANPHSTKLLSANVQDFELVQPSSQSVFSRLFDRPTTLLPGSTDDRQRPFPQPSNAKDAPISYGYIGLSDFTMHPMIRPGSLVRIDTSQTKPQAVTQHNQFDRPIYFVELRDGYACGWCELQGNDLLIIPHHSSPARIRRFTYIKDAEIVGRVVSFDTRCVDEDVKESDVRPKSKRILSKVAE